MKLVHFGAGNIGRSFLGQLFGRAGWEVVFVDVVPEIIEAINTQKAYRVIIKESGRPDETILVEGVRAVDGRQPQEVARELADADLASTSVGKTALPHILPALARGLAARAERADTQQTAEKIPPPLDLIIAENIRGAAKQIREGLADLLPDGFPLSERLGLVETSIGKMVPLMREEDREEDPLQVFSEAYNTLIVDRMGFLGPLPRLENLMPVDNIRAYVDRKLFIHNMGHAASAYLGYLARPEATLLPDVLRSPGVLAEVRAAMNESADALAAEYPLALDREDLDEHIEDLIRRFQNHALGDTVYRVGRDLKRKLHKEDRLLGAVILAARHGLPRTAMETAFLSALEFRATDEEGRPFAGDEDFVENHLSKGLAGVLTDVCELDPREPVESTVYRELTERISGYR